MSQLLLLLLMITVLLPAAGALWVRLTRDPDTGRSRSLMVSGLALAFALLAWGSFEASSGPGSNFHRGPLIWGGFSDLFGLDHLNAPLLPLVALIHFLTILATLRTKVREFSFARSLASESILLATLSVRQSWGLVALLIAGTIPPLLELRKAAKPTRVYLLHMGLFASLLIVGQASLSGYLGQSATPGIVLVAAAVLLRSGVVPVHCWMSDLFEHATFGTALLFVTPMVGAYGFMRLVLPDASTFVLEAMSVASLATAVYAAGMALVQREARRFFCYLFLSHSSLVLIGLGTGSAIGVTGGLSLWISVALALTGFGLTLRCVESRAGRIPLSGYQGLYTHVPTLAALFLLTGLASIGFPGTIGFVSLELLVEGAIQAQPLEGSTVVLIAALNGLAVMYAYFRIFTGKPHTASIDLSIRPAERVSVLVLTALILGGGLYPQPGLSMLYHTAQSLVGSRDGHTHAPEAHATVTPLPLANPAALRSH